MTARNPHVLLDRYLSAIGNLLPDAEREDILRELRANLEARLDDLAESSGREPSEDDVCRILREHGHPAVVAARYRQQEALIGPVVWPYFWAGLKVIGILVAVGSVVNAMLNTFLAQGADAWAHFLPRLLLGVFEIGLPFLGLWVLIMAVVERGWARGGASRNWDPRSLKKDGAGSAAHTWAEGAADGLKSVASSFGDPACWKAAGKSTVDAAQATASAVGASGWCERREKNRRGRAFGEFFGACVGLIIWYALLKHGGQFFPHAQMNFALGPVWRDVFETVLGLLALQCLILLPPVALPHSAPLRHACKALSHFVGAGILWLFLKQPPLFVTTPLQPGQADLTFVVDQITRWQHPALLLFAAIAVLQGLYRVGRFAASFFKD
ncbi:hypothetical protein [Nibricoccus sp. IMCC34717]|uniref:hypothetical protein n=1 Tax=Nibricoccus sp. IMCC34717 TaxID=3034021 RepID=UPI00384B7E54